MLNEAVGRAKEITAFAAQPANWYRIGESTWIPGNRPEYVLGAAGNIRAVFSFTWVSDDEVYRHLTISAPHSLPSPLFVWTLAHAFGFTGAEADKDGIVQKPSMKWVFGYSEEEGCIVVQERLAS
jgi:hypothetical protein